MPRQTVIDAEKTAINTMRDRNNTEIEPQAQAEAQTDVTTDSKAASGPDANPDPRSRSVSTTIACVLAPVARFGEGLEAYCETAIARVLAVPSSQRVGMLTAVMMLLAAVDPVAAQSEFCDSAFGELILALEGLGVGVGTAVLGFMLLIGIMMMVLTPVFPGQSAVGLVLVFMVLAAGILMVFGLSFLGLIFDIAGVGGESCSTLVD